jgi:hypothetical protein
MPTLDTITLVSVAKQLNIVSVLSYLLPIVVCVRRWSLLPASYRGLVFGALLSIWSLSILSEVGRVVWHNNLLSNYLSIWAETLFLSAAYYQAYHTRSSRRVLLGALLLFVLVAAVECLSWHDLFGAKTYTSIARSGLLIGAALIYFEQVLHELRNIRLEHDPMFLVSVGVTLYYAGTLMVFVLEYSMHRQHQSNQIWIMYIIEFVLLIGFNVLLGLAVYRASARSRNVAPPQLY